MLSREACAFVCSFDSAAAAAAHLLAATRLALAAAAGRAATARTGTRSS
jgi:hypothetical protein